MKSIWICLCLIGMIHIPNASAQRIWKKIQWTHHGPFELPENSTDSGQWTPNGMGWVEMLHFTKDGTLYASGNSGGLYRFDPKKNLWCSRNGGAEHLGVLDMVSDPNKPSRLFLATGNTAWDDDWGTGIWFSKNSGKSWQKTSLQFRPEDKRPIWQLESAIGNFKHQIALTEHEIYKTGDAWMHHELVYRSRELNFRSLLFAPASDSVVYASGALLLRSLDGGTSWQDLTERLQASDDKRSRYRRIAIAVCPLQPQSLWAMYPAGGRIYLDKSDDYGQSWRNVSIVRNISRFDENHAELAVAPDDTSIIYAGAVRLYRSDDAGRSFKQITFPVWKHPQFQHDDIRELIAFPNGLVYTGNDGGVGKSNNHGNTWTDISGKGLCITQFYGIGLNPQGTEIMGGCQDLGNMHYNIQSKQWRNISELYGDGGGVLSNKRGWVVTQNGTLFSSNSSARKWQHIRGQQFISRMWMPMAFDVRNNGAIYTADQTLYRIQTPGSAENIGYKLRPSEHKIWAFKQAASHPDRAYLAFDQPTWNSSSEGLQGKLYRCNRFTDSIPLWTDITANLSILAWRSITHIEVHPDNPDMIWVCFKVFDAKDQEAHRVYMSNDGGLSWQNHSEGLPNHRARAIRYIGGYGRLMVLGTDAGIYMRRWYDPEWQLIRFKKSIPECMVSDLIWDQARNTLWVSTYGNGLWSARIPEKLLR